MERDDAKKAHELIEEIDDLKCYKGMFNTARVNQIGHFEIRPTYGQCSESERIDIDVKHNPKFIKVLEDIINELEQELLDL